MKVEKFDGVIESAHGKPLSAFNKGVNRLTYETTYEHLENNAEIPAKEQPEDKDILALVNAKRKQAARAAAVQVQLDAAGIVKPTLEDDGLLRLRNIYKNAIASGRSHDEARNGAEMLTGEKWATYGE